MKDYLIEIVRNQTGFNARLNIMREYLQAYILQVMYKIGFFRSSAFVGGTALRFLYKLPRFSEDLDFSLIKNSEISFMDILKKIKYEMEIAGYDVTISYDDTKTVKSAFVKFSGLMYLTGLSGHKEQKFSIKIKIDYHPPEGAKFETRIVNKYFPIAFLSYDIALLFSAKLHCILTRKYTKGRDYFDLGWYI